MTIRNLQSLFAPRAVALIGASNEPGSIGRVLAGNLASSGFRGPVLPVNPHAAAIGSTLAYPNVDALPTAPDLAVVATPPQTVPGLIAELGQRGCKAAIVITAGFSGALRQELLDAARPHLLRLIGPNCLGVISPAAGLNASFAQVTPRPGGLALVSQSGAITTAALDWACAREIGFSHVVSLGDMADVDFGDMLDYLALDPATTAILLYIESVTDARKFISAGRAAARAKPVVVIKAGRSQAGAKAAFSHTGALAGADEVYDAAFRRAGMLRVDGLRELFDAVATLGAGLHPLGERLAILTNGGGAGVLAVDALAARNGVLAELAPQTVAALDAVLPRTWSHANPVDIIGDAGPDRYAAALEALLEDPNADGVLILNCPTAVADSTAAADAVLSVLRGRTGPPAVLTCWLGDTSAREGRRRFAAAGFPTHETPGEAVRAFAHLVEYRRNQAQLFETPPAAPRAPDRDAAAQVIAAARSEGRAQLTDREAKAVLSAYGVPVVADLRAATPEDAAAAARKLPPPYALKVDSPDISHKTDVGGVILNLPSPEAVGDAARAMTETIRTNAPAARLKGFIVQPMIVRPHARELIAGLATDPTFGPVVLVGQGGIAVEVLKDRVIGLPPLNRILARDMIDRTQAAKLLAAYRDRPAADVDAVAEVLERLSLLAIEQPAIAELDINPLLVDESGVLALDARIGLAAGARARTAIATYPRDLERSFALPEGEDLTIRPVRPDDEAALMRLMAATSPEDLTLRFRGGVGPLSHLEAARLSQIDYDREMTLVGVAATGMLDGVGRLVSDPEGEHAEFGLLVRTDRQGHGVGRALLEALIDYAHDRGLSSIWGEIDRANAAMLELAGATGFVRRRSDDPGLVRVLLSLDPANGGRSAALPTSAGAA